MKFFKALEILMRSLISKTDANGQRNVTFVNKMGHVIVRLSSMAVNI